ncbi:MAG: C39 family peptidase [Peptostreptococcaceae bacterium]|jgi:hypothetical protein|nr:C39 family peptidase [Peptostreptococcaceae bacterium]
MMGNMLVAFGKKLVIDLFTDPEKIVKAILYFIIFPILLILLLFAIPINMIVSIPAVLLEGDSTGGLTEEQLKVVGIYQDAPIVINKQCLEWVEKKKEKYSYADDIRVTYNFNLTWQDLMAIDAVLLNQDFKKARKRKVLDLGEKFVIQEDYIEKYKVKKTRTVTGKDGKTRRKTRWVTRTRAIIKVSTKSFEEVINDLGFNNFEKEVAENIYKTILQTDIEGNLNIYDDVDLGDLKEYPPGNATLPYFNQADKRWGNLSYGSSTIRSGGCGPTSLAIVVAGLTGRTDINPKVVADWSVRNGHRAEGAGSYWSLMTEGGKHYGLKVEAVSRKNPKKIVDALSKGYPVIVSMGRGHFTKSGHFMVLRGITKDGKILVNDPASVKRSNQEWNLSIIMNESSTNGGVNGSPFWIYRP